VNSFPISFQELVLAENEKYQSQQVNLSIKSHSIVGTSYIKNVGRPEAVLKNRVEA
jgi:hypothetical protein